MTSRIIELLQRILTSPSPPDVAEQDVKQSSMKETIVQYDRNWFETLPTEVILTITDQLDKEFIVLFGLSCRYVYNVLKSNINLTFHDRSARIRFLHHLEIDHPEYLTCRNCDKMFKWQSKSEIRHTCSGTAYYTKASHQQLSAINISSKQHCPVFINQELVDLISRARELGPKYGIPISTLNGSGKGNNGIPRTVEARWVDDQLLVATRWVLDPNTKHEMAEKLWVLNPALCLHWWTNMARGRWRTLEHRVLAMKKYEEQSPTKCWFCATDSRVSLQDAGGDQPRVIVNVWRNFGSRRLCTKETAQMFVKQPQTELNSNAVMNRDLQALFESKDGDLATLS